MNLRFKGLALSIVVVNCLSGCFQDKLAEGNRVNIIPTPNSVESLKIELPIQVNKSSWHDLDQKGKVESQNHLLRKNVQSEWIIETGLGKSIGSPVSYKDKVFVLGADGNVKCIDLTNQETLWSFLLHPTGDIRKRIIGGGLAFDDAENLYVTTSLGDFLSVSIESGVLNWRYKSKAPIMDRPTVINNDIIITDASGLSRSFSSKGKLNWSVEGVASEHIRSKIGRPVSFGKLLLLPSPGGVLNAVNASDGSEVWSFNFVDQRLGYAQNTFGAFNGDPGVFLENIYYGSANGQFNALNKFGESLWQTEVGLQGSPLLISNSIFFISDRNQLMRLNKNTGDIIWSRTITSETNPQHYFTPILAGSKLWLTGSDTFLRSFNVKSGTLNDQIDIKAKSVGPPIYYSETLIVHTETGELIAFK